LHRDSTELSETGFPVFSLGTLPTGPRRLDARPADVFSRATVGSHAITTADVVVADANGVLFLPEDRLEDVIAAAIICRDTEARQLSGMKADRSYRTQVRFDEYIARRERDPTYVFRRHLEDAAAAGEV
jgi:4-hydroxy-4-methyl-2-oxoglutarate aldolase